MATTRVIPVPQRVAILKRHLVEHVPISRLCDEHKIHVNTFYHWLKVFFENGAAAFEASVKPKVQVDAKDRKIAKLEAQLTRKNEVIAELLEDHTSLKKSLGDS